MAEPDQWSPFHPVLGCAIRGPDGREHPVYTRTVVLWAVGIRIDPDRLWECIEVRDTNSNRAITTAEDIVAVRGVAGAAVPRGCRRSPPPATRTPVVRMATTATKRRGNLAKRMRCGKSFRSVLSLDVECGGHMPNLKISRRNTIQATGVQDLRALGAILQHLVAQYGTGGRGIDVVNAADAGFVGEVVLANLQFRLDWPVRREQLRDSINAMHGGGPFLASFEPLVNDVSVSVKHASAAPLPCDGAVYPRLRLAADAAPTWTAVTEPEVRKLAPGANLSGGAAGAAAVRVTSLRVFASGCTVVVGRWPGEMCDVFVALRNYLRPLRRTIVPRWFARQLTLDKLWCASGRPAESAVVA